jgi:hypothetical protein
MKAKKFIASVLMLPAMASAEFFSGNDLLSKINSTDVSTRIQAIGYVQGVADVYMAVTFCPPNGITAGQLVDISRAYLENNAPTRHRTAESLLNEAFKQVWPCAQRSGRKA